MLFIMLTVIISGIPAGIYQGEALYTDLSGNCLYLGQNIISSEPGSGRNTVSAEEHLYWEGMPRGREPASGSQ